MEEKHIQAKQDYIQGMKYKDIAEKYEVSINTVKSWKRRYEWSREKGAHKTKRVHTKKKGGQPGNKNAAGHGAPPRNTNAVKHGLFSKYMPAETMEIIEAMQERTPADLIYDQIEIQYAAIIRAQHIMFVESKDEMIKEVKKEKESWGDSSSSSETEWEFQFAWDRQATFLTAQSRAMSEFRNLVKQFVDMANEDDERRIKLEQMQLNVDKTKAEIEKITKDDNKNAPPVINIIDAWSNEDE